MAASLPMDSHATLFKEIDQDNDGFISIAELKESLERRVPGLEQYLRKYDRNQDARIDFQDSQNDKVMEFQMYRGVKRPYSDVMCQQFEHDDKENVCPDFDSKRFKPSLSSSSSSAGLVGSSLLSDMAKTTFMLSKQLAELNNKLNGATSIESPLLASFASSGYNSSSHGSSSFVCNSTMDDHQFNESIHQSVLEHTTQVSYFESHRRSAARTVLGEIPAFKLDHPEPISGAFRQTYATPRTQTLPTNASPPKINRLAKTGFSQSFVESSASPESTTRQIVKRICF